MAAHMTRLTTSSVRRGLRPTPRLATTSPPRIMNTLIPPHANPHAWTDISITVFLR